ncbi:hypothetical protein C8R43DRAFT_243936 [Mycena crocata]|nr:hypothetical protein C8R43DRAFT_243936 [Mycena crocata]
MHIYPSSFTHLSIYLPSRISAYLHIPPSSRIHPHPHNAVNIYIILSYHSYRILCRIPYWFLGSFLVVLFSCVGLLLFLLVAIALCGGRHCPVFWLLIVLTYVCGRIWIFLSLELERSTSDVQPLHSHFSFTFYLSLSVHDRIRIRIRHFLRRFYLLLVRIRTIFFFDDLPAFFLSGVVSMAAAYIYLHTCYLWNLSLTLDFFTLEWNQ